MTVVVLRLGSKGENSGDNAIRLLSKMFSMNLSYEEKLDTLQNEFQISVSREMSEEVQNVCNLSTGVYRKGYDSGYDSGISEGRMEQARGTAYRLLDKGMPAEEVAEMVETGMDTLREWMEEREKAPVK